MNKEGQPTLKYKERPWVVDTTEGMRKPGGRDLADYENFLGFNRRECVGKTVLDLGSGSTEKLSRELKKAGAKSIVSLNPDYSLLKYRQIINNQKDWERKSVAGVGQALPFQNDSFDVILGLQSISMYEDAFEKPESAKEWAQEVARVLKPGGEARLGEILGIRGVPRQKAWEKILHILEDLGLEAKIEPFVIKEANPDTRHRLIIKKPFVN